MFQQAITNFHNNLARIRRADYNETEVRVPEWTLERPAS